MRVLQTVHSRTFAGTERHILALTRELTRLGHEVTIACPRSAEGLRTGARELGIPVLGIGAALWARRLDVVHCHDGRSAISGVALAAASGARFVRTQHFVRPASSDRGGAVGAASLVAHRWVNARVDGYICVSRAAAQAARARRDHPGQITVIGPGIDVPGHAVWRASVGVRAAAGVPVVVSAGRLEPERSFETLIRAIPEVRQAHPGCEFVIAGEGTAAAGLRALAGELGVAPAIRWPGWVSDLGAELGRAHLYVNTWPFEGFGMATAEAMAAGVPVLVTGSGAAPELIEGGVGGWAVPPRDPVALAGRLVELLADRPRLAATGEQARERAAALYSTSAAAAAVAGLYDQLAGTGTRRQIRVPEVR